jgi:hypothetical protein
MPDVLGKYFRSKEIKTFQRQLNYYGFRRIKYEKDDGMDVYAYDGPGIYTRGNYKEAIKIPRRNTLMPTSNKRSKSKAPAYKHESNDWRIPRTRNPALTKQSPHSVHKGAETSQSPSANRWADVGSNLIMTKAKQTKQMRHKLKYKLYKASQNDAIEQPQGQGQSPITTKTPEDVDLLACYCKLQVQKQLDHAGENAISTAQPESTSEDLVHHLHLMKNGTSIGLGFSSRLITSE